MNLPLAQGMLKRMARGRVARAVGLGGPKMYRPNVAQWEVLLVLGESGPLPASTVTVVQAHVNRHAADALAEAGLVVIGDDGMVELTDRGHTRVRMGW